MSANGRECAGDAAAYVLGALEPAEAEAFRRHIADCPQCREDVAAFEHVTDALPASTTSMPVPTDLRRRVMREVRATPQEAGPTAARHARSSPVQVPPARWPMLAIAGAFAAVIAVVVAIAVSSGGSSGTRVVAASVSGVTGSAQLRIAGDRGELIARGLPQPPAGRIYEMWVQRGNAPPTPTGTLFSVTSRGAVAVGVPGSLDGITAVLVTQEPAGGTLAPTSAPVIAARVA